MFARVRRFWFTSSILLLGFVTAGAPAVQADQLMNVIREPVRSIYPNGWPAQAASLPQGVSPQGGVVPPGAVPAQPAAGWRWPWQRRPAQPTAAAVPLVSPTVVQRPMLVAPANPYPVQPTTAYSPALAPGTGACACPTPCPTNCPTACPTACPQPAFAQPVTVQPTVVQYRPYVSFRSLPQVVPVTDYRPVTVVDSTTGRPVTVMRPCVRQAATVQRVPFTAYHPGRVVQGPPQVIAGGVISGNPCCNQTAAVADPCQGCQGAPEYYSSPAPQPGVPTLPGPVSVPGQPGSLQPGSMQPGTIQPGFPAQPGTSQPGQWQPQGGEPASQQPSLDPSGLPRQAAPPSQSSLRPAAPTPGQVLSASPEAREETGAGVAGGGMQFPPRNPAAAGVRLEAQGTPQVDLEHAVPTQPPAADPLRDLKPLPDPDYNLDWREREPPQLLNPNDKTARRENPDDLQRVSHIRELPPVAAPAVVHGTRAPVPAAIGAPAPSEPWDDGGWTSLSPGR